MLFAIGSALFGVASLPGASSLSETADSIVYFTGSLFFTAAAFDQMRLSESDPTERTSVITQFLGTLCFNVTTFLAIIDGDADLLVWAPDAVGSVLFLLSSGLAARAVRHERDLARREARLNFLGSVLFGLSAIGAFVIPNLDRLLNASLARIGTLWGAVCFLIAAVEVSRGRPLLFRAEVAG